jgi:hypothetical protein
LTEAKEMVNLLYLVLSTAGTLTIFENEILSVKKESAHME